ncbi:MAG: nitroreductase family protein [Clostridiales bacterium]|nr:nitroreductase family protein [Clostridiales bacterium]
MDIYETIFARRSIRKYRPDPVADETLMRLARAAIAAPNGGNAQPWDFVFVTDTALIGKLCAILEQVHGEYFGTARRDALAGERLERAVSAYGRMAVAPAFVLACKNIRNQQLNDSHAAWSDIWAHHSIAAAMENLILAAVAEGLGTCWLGTPGWQAGTIRELLHIPAHVEILALSPIGYPDEAPRARPRMAVEEVTHFNSW